MLKGSINRFPSISLLPTPAPQPPDSLLQHMFVVRFLGSMAVRSDHTVEVIYEATRQVLAARAIHNIFRTTESHLLVTSNDLK